MNLVTLKSSHLLSISIQLNERPTCWMNFVSQLTIHFFFHYSFFHCEFSIKKTLRIMSKMVLFFFHVKTLKIKFSPFSSELKSHFILLAYSLNLQSIRLFAFLLFGAITHHRFLKSIINSQKKTKVKNGWAHNSLEFLINHTFNGTKRVKKKIKTTKSKNQKTLILYASSASTSRCRLWFFFLLILLIVNQ